MFAGWRYEHVQCHRFHVGLVGDPSVSFQLCVWSQVPACYPPAPHFPISQVLLWWPMCLLRRMRVENLWWGRWGHGRRVWRWATHMSWGKIRVWIIFLPFLVPKTSWSIRISHGIRKTQTSGLRSGYWLNVGLQPWAWGSDFRSSPRGPRFGACRSIPHCVCDLV